MLKVPILPWVAMALLAASIGPLYSAVIQESQTGTRVVLLGTGTPNAEPERSGPATAILVNGTPYLVDFGPGVIRRAAAAGIKPKQLTRAFVTHLHSDHTVGYPDLVLSAWTLDRSEPLEVYGPPGIKSMTDYILKAYQEDIELRINGSEPTNTEGYKVKVHEIQPGLIYEDSNVRVKAFPVDHGSWRYAYGYRFETAQRTIVISGDTRPSESLIKNARGCDVLIHEVYSQKKFSTKPPEWQKYHASFHTSSMELGRLAAKVKPGLLILYHILAWGATDEDLLKEVRENYDGPVVMGKDLQVY